MSGGEHFVSSFDKVIPTRQRWLEDRRKDALARFGQLGFPTRKHEAWKYTNVKGIAETAFEPARPDQALPPAGFLSTLPDLGGARLVFVNGLFAQDLSRLQENGKGLTVLPLSEAFISEEERVRSVLGDIAEEKDQAFTALNSAFCADGAWIRAARGKQAAQPVQLVFIAQAANGPTVGHPRVLIEAEAGSSVTVVEHYMSRGDGLTFTNAVTEVLCGQNARVERIKLQTEGRTSFHVQTFAARCERDAVVSDHNLTFGGALTRNNLNVLLGGQGAHGELNGLFVTQGTQHVDNHSLVDHAVPHCTSRELYKGILDDNSHGVFSGMVIVREDAQKTSAEQSNPNLLLSRKAQIDTRPQLIINADDVKCSHGATIGRLDPDSLFFLRSRGIGKDEARRMLTVGFANELIDALPVEELRSYAQGQLNEHLYQEASA